jgi:anti-sigma regulatory factor (Ser/Thr protein kinase)
VLPGRTARQRFEPADVSVGEVRRLAREVLAGRPSLLVSRVEAVLSELATNALVHTHATFEVAVRVGPVLRVEVTDVSEHPPQTRPLDPFSFGGRGLHIVDAYADRWGFERTSTGKVVWAEFGDAR